MRIRLIALLLPARLLFSVFLFFLLKVRPGISEYPSRRHGAGERSEGKNSPNSECCTEGPARVRSALTSCALTCPRQHSGGCVYAA